MSGRTDRAVGAGLPVVDVSPGVDYDKLQMEFVQRNPEMMLKPRENKDGESGADDFQFENIARLFAEVSAPTVDRTVELARQWRPDAILYTPVHGTGPLAAAAVGVPAVMQGFNMVLGSEMTSAIAQSMSAHYERHGLASDDVKPAAILDVAPPSLRRQYDEQDNVWPIRYLPYNGGGVLPQWLNEPRKRPRVTVTLGSTVPGVGGIDLLQRFVEAAGTMDAEFVLALAGADLSRLGELPDNLVPVDWVPLAQLLAVSDAVIHHGGGGSTLTAAAAGVPQYVVPHGGDNFVHAKLIRARGLGDELTPSGLDEQRLAELIEDGPMRAAAREVAAEMQVQDTFSALIPKLVDLTR
ncbi:glycosyltransferase [Streptomyces sp. NBC_01549]|nr:glycosyltransferase [Streptomyces sp. NBC_01549]